MLLPCTVCILITMFDTVPMDSLSRITNIQSGQCISGWEASSYEKLTSLMVLWWEKYFHMLTVQTRKWPTL